MATAAPGIIGEIGRREEGKFDWRISEFLSLPERDSACYFSHDFDSLGYQWYLEILPNGHIADGTEGWIKLGLSISDQNSCEEAVKFKLGIIKSDGTEILGEEQCHTFSSDNDSSFEVKFLERSELIKCRSMLVPSGTLTVTCIFRNDEQQHIEEDPFIHSLMNLSCNLKDALLDRESADVVLKLKSREIPAHRVILKSRSTVLKEMLDSGTRKKRSAVIDLVDDDEVAFDVVLSHIYSGEAETLDKKNVREVYKLAHKYNLQDLRRQCCSYMKKNMSLDLICDVLAIAYLYEEPELKERANNYFLRNETEIVEMEEWMALQNENRQVEIDMHEYIYPGRAPS